MAFQHIKQIVRQIRRSARRIELKDEKSRAYLEECIASALGEITANLRAIKAAAETGDQKNLRAAIRTYYSMPGAKFCAVLRAFDKKSKSKSQVTDAGKAKPKGYDLDVLIGVAATLNMTTKMKEPVVVWEEAKSKGGVRTLMSFGPKRTARALLLRDALSMAGIDNELDFSRPGAGGERALADEVSNCLMEGDRFWWTPDVANFYPSIKPGHLRWIPVDRNVLVNVAFLPEGVRMKKVKSGNPDEALGQQLLGAAVTSLTPSVESNGCLPLCIAQQQVQQGLPQGSCLSPLLSRAFLGRVLREFSPSYKEIRFACWNDDLTIGAKSLKVLTELKEALGNNLFTQPAGPILLKGSPIQDMNQQPLDALGLTFVCQASGQVHVKPGIPRLNRKRQRLWEKLDNAGDANADFHEIGIQYARAWFAAQPAWTKVPFHSWDSCEAAAFFYVEDWLNHSPMGGFTKNPGSELEQIKLLPLPEWKKPLLKNTTWNAEILEEKKPPE